MQNQSTFVLYHRNCYDGFGAAWAAWKALGERAEYLPVNYDDDGPPAIPDDSIVVIVDFSYDRGTLEEMAGRMAELTVLDHHDTAEQALAGLEYAIFDQDKSGAVLAWEFFHPHVEVPELLRYVEDRDLWRWRLPQSRQVSAALRMHPKDFESWNFFVTDEGIAQLKQEGNLLFRFTSRQVEMICEQAKVCRVGTYDGIPVVNSTVFWSEVGELLLEQYPEAPFSASYHVLDSGKVKWSLRSRGDLHVGKWAEQWGGGGHPGAAGFHTGADALVIWGIVEQDMQEYE